ncbi:MAG: hypothetical protein N3E49_04080 [Bacteroidia bacterium]|nr:hypothetical protein [Bacteroidia bacterium]
MIGRVSRPSPLSLDAWAIRTSDWSALNGVIAGMGALLARCSHSRVDDEGGSGIESVASSGNIGVDVGYIAAGALLIVRDALRLRGTDYRMPPQKAGLLILSTQYALKLHVNVFTTSPLHAPAVLERLSPEQNSDEGHSGFAQPIPHLQR